MIELTHNDITRLHKFATHIGEVLNASFDDSAALLLDEKWEAEACWDKEGNVIVKLREVSQDS